MIRFLAGRVRRAHNDGEHCALWIDCRYLEPFGGRAWAVIIHPMGRKPYEAARSRWLWLALWRALEAA